MCILADQGTYSGNEYVAIKIISSGAPKKSKELEMNRRITANNAARGHIVTLLDDFKHVGPNGDHDCLVFEPMGPDFAAYFQRSIPLSQGRSIVKQLLTALRCLHDLRIAHGDTNPGNMLLSLTQPIDDPSESGNSMFLRVHGKLHPHAPSYIHEDWPIVEYWHRMNPPKLRLSDFGGAFPFNDPPQRPIMAVALRAPEIVLQSNFDHTVDIWSFGCYLFEIVTGHRLFALSGFHAGPDDPDSQEEDDSHLLQMIRTLGPLPPAIFEEWPRRMRYFDADLKLVRTDVGKSEIPYGAINIGEMLEQQFQNGRPRKMTAKEGDALLQVLRSASQYDAARRPSATELLSLD